MSKKYIIISTLVDNLIQEMQPSIDFYVFNSLKDLAEYIELKPIRADRLFITREILQPAVTSSLSFLRSMLKEFYLRIDKVDYITEKDSDEIKVVEYLIKEENLLNWSIAEGSLTREFVSNFICGNLKTDDFEPERKVIIRQRKSELKRTSLRNDEILDEDYPVEESFLEGIPKEDIHEIAPMDYGSICKILRVSGLKTFERSVFSFILAQYSSFTGKTVIVERDYDFLTLTDMVSKSGVSCTKIKVNNLYKETREVLRRIRLSNDRLIVLIAEERGNMNYNLICSILYNNLSDCLDYMVMETDFEELASTSEYVTVIPNNTIDLLKTCNEIPDGYKENSSYVGVNARSIKELSILDSKAFEYTIKDLLNYEDELEIPIVNIESLKVGGEAHDLRRFI